LLAELAVIGELPHLLIAQTWPGFVDPKVLAEGFKKYDLLSTFYRISTLGGKRKGWL
jgi:hypothetical protein